ncbi:MAG TPA: histidine kinase [Microlunatus sp.]
MRGTSTPAGGPGKILTGFVRSVILSALALLVPAVSTLPALMGWLLGSPWSPTNVWSWVGFLIIFGVLALLFARLIGRIFRRLTADWCGIKITDGYRRPEDEPEPVQLATGYWWNGHSYERTRRDAELDQRRQRWSDPAYWRDVRWVIIAAVILGPVCAIPAVAVVVAVIIFVHPAAAGVAIGMLLLLTATATAPYCWKILAPLAHRWLRLSERAVLAQRVRRLEAQRADATATQAAEIRRIERDLHDGAQAGLVSLGLTLATAEKLMEKDPERARALLREARKGASTSLAELRELVRGINPPVLVERGLVDALRSFALDSQQDITVGADLDRRLDAPLEAALYFSVVELLTNVAKHAPAAGVQVRIHRSTGGIVVEVADDGPGGAEARTGGGLDGIRRRLEAFDGSFRVESPAGGPTHAMIEVPCG